MIYLDLIKKFTKEDNDVLIIAEKNAAILKNRLESDLHNLNGDKMTLELDLNLAKEQVNRANATITHNYELWSKQVTLAEEAMYVIEDSLENIKDSMKRYKERLKLFTK